MFQRNKAPPVRVAQTLPPRTEEVFRGFVSGGGGFRTKKGFNGMKLETQWANQLMDSFKNDDVELLEIALESSLADVHDRVIGG